MTDTKFSIVSPQAGTMLNRLSLVLLLGFVASLQACIALAGVLLTATLLCWFITLVQERKLPTAPAFFMPLVAYAGITLLSCAFSTDPLASLSDSRELLLFLIVPAVYQIVRSKREATTVIDVIVSVGAVSATVGIIQYAVFHYDNLGQRPQGALTHYMTYSGLIMLVLCAAVARLMFGKKGRTWPALVLPALAVALAVTFTRSAWIGAIAGVSVLLALKNLRLVAILPVGIILVLMLTPNDINQRMRSIFDLTDPTNRDRLAMVYTGTAMITDHPLTGVGPDMVERLYPTYRDPRSVNMINQHLHNVPLQIAAERGLPALGIWIWFLILLTSGLIKRARQPDLQPLASTGLATVAAMLLAGLFEYNFGDSEFLMLFLVLVTLPFAAQTGRGEHEHGPAQPR